jgi:hypothetical protein
MGQRVVSSTRRVVIENPRTDVSDSRACEKFDVKERRGAYIRRSNIARPLLMRKKSV